MSACIDLYQRLLERLAGRYGTDSPQFLRASMRLDRLLNLIQATGDAGPGLPPKDPRSPGRKDRDDPQ